MKEIKLAEETIDKKDISALIGWLQTEPQLTKGPLTHEFEKKWSRWQGVKYSVFVNSGSSANLLALYSLIAGGQLKNKKIILPAVSWATTVSPALQLGFTPFLCDCNKRNLGLDTNHLEELFKKEKPSVLCLVHVLGFPNDMDKITELCNIYSVKLIEDSCESIGSTFNNKKTGSFGDLSTFSFFFGHHMSTIEGGMVCTNNRDLYVLLLSLRSHGWDRDLPTDVQQKWRKTSEVSDFRALYTFYHPGFNLRPTEPQAFLGIRQLSKIEKIITKRQENFRLYHHLIKNKEWKIKPKEREIMSNFAYPIITKHLPRLSETLCKNKIQCRPLVCGSINKQPFWKNHYPPQATPTGDWLHDHGLYLPNHPQLSPNDIRRISSIVNQVIN